LEQWERDGEIILSRNEKYWDNHPKTERMRIRILSEVMTQSAEFEAGSLDILEVPQGEMEYWKQYNYNQLDVDELNIWYIGMNCSRSPFNDVRLRRAMNYAIDREKIIHILLDGSATLANGPLPPRLLDEVGEMYYEYNPNRAIQLLKEAGFDNDLHTELYVAGGSECFMYWKHYNPIGKKLA
jgi:ABC-type transport system substrate-binding protein